jgi:hypothetical protein
LVVLQELPYDNPCDQAKCYQPYSRYRFHRLKISRQSFRKSLSEIPKSIQIMQSSFPLFLFLG